MHKFDIFAMNTAIEASKMSTANRLKVGCIAVRDGRILSVGYNGMPSGWSNECEVDDKTKPEVLHAEANCLMKLAQSTETSKDSILFITHSPCVECAKLIHQAGVRKVIYKTKYRVDAGIDFLTKSKIEVIKYED